MAIGPQVISIYNHLFDKIDSKKIKNVCEIGRQNLSFNSIVDDKMKSLFKKFNTFYLWEKDNFWYDELIQEYDKRSLLKLFFPKKNHLNKFRITPSNLVNENSLKIQEFLDFHKKKKAIILFLEEDFDTMENKFRSKTVNR